MILKPPVFITSRLLPGVKIGDATISIERGNNTIDITRAYYNYYIDLNGRSFSSKELQSGVSGGTLQEGLESLIGFLSAFAEAILYRKVIGKMTENINLFPADLADWAVENVDKFVELQCELQEKELIIE